MRKEKLTKELVARGVRHIRGRELGLCTEAELEGHLQKMQEVDEAIMQACISRLRE